MYLEHVGWRSAGSHKFSWWRKKALEPFFYIWPAKSTKALRVQVYLKIHWGPKEPFAKRMASTLTARFTKSLESPRSLPNPSLSVMVVGDGAMDWSSTLGKAVAAKTLSLLSLYSSRQGCLEFTELDTADRDQIDSADEKKGKTVFFHFSHKKNMVSHPVLSCQI